MLKFTLEAVNQQIGTQPKYIKKLLESSLLGVQDLEQQIANLKNEIAAMKIEKDQAIAKLEKAYGDSLKHNQQALDFQQQTVISQQKALADKQDKIVHLKISLMQHKGTLHARGVIEELETKYSKSKNETRKQFYVRVLKENTELTTIIQSFHGIEIKEEEIAKNLCEIYSHLSAIINEFVPLLEEELENSGLTKMQQQYLQAIGSVIEINLPILAKE